MKKIVISIIAIVALILMIVAVKISDLGIKQTELKRFNAQFEQYKDKTIYGSDIYTIINKADDNNKKYDIKKDNEGNYIADEEYSIKVDLILLTKDEKENIIEVKHPMEKLQKAGLDGFITNFSMTTFSLEEIKYNKFGRVSKITVKQLET